MKKTHFFGFFNTSSRRPENLLRVFAFGQKGSTMNKIEVVSGQTGGNKVTRASRASLIALTLAAGMLLAACGGGGGGGGTTPPSPPPPPPPAPPSLTLASTAPDNGATGVDVTNFAAHLNFRNGGGQMDSATGTFRTTCGGADVASTTLMTLDTANSTARFAVTITGTMPFSTVCQVSTTNVQGSGPGGTSAAVSATLTFTTKAAPAWWPPEFVPQGTKVYLDKTTAPAGAVTNATFPGQTLSGMLPMDCKLVGDDCWKEATRNGTIKFVQGGGRDPTVPNEPVVFAFYRVISQVVFPGQDKVLYCNRPILQKDGTYGTPDVVENHCSVEEKPWLQGTSEGALLEEKYSNGAATCYRRFFDQTLNGWTSVPTTCS